MPTPTYINADDFPGSPYARELKGGLKRLRFEPQLEHQYLQQELQRVRTRARVWFGVNALMTLVFAIAQLQRSSGQTLSLALHLGVLLPCALALAWLTWNKHYWRSYLPVGTVLVGIFSVLIAIYNAQGLVSGRDEELAGLTVNLLAIFFFTGFRFRAALCIAAMIVLAFAAASFVFALPTALAIKSLVVLLITALIGGIAHRDIERACRKNFLEDALIGELAARDGLTGLTNRRTLDEHLLRVWRHALRDRRLLSLLMIDIDHFKHYNDAHGHQAGDTVLRAVSQLLMGFARRPLDIAARYGGEEFVIVLYDLAPENVQDVAERIRASIRHCALPEGLDAVTVSIGVALLTPTLGRAPEGALQLADEALYEAKRAGRNRIVTRGLEEYRELITGSFKLPDNARG